MKFANHLFLSLLGGFLAILSRMVTPLLVEAHLSLCALGGAGFLPPHAYVNVSGWLQVVFPASFSLGKVAHSLIITSPIFHAIC